MKSWETKELAKSGVKNESKQLGIQMRVTPASNSSIPVSNTVGNSLCPQPSSSNEKVTNPYMDVFKQSQSSPHVLKQQQQDEDTFWTAHSYSFSSQNAANLKEPFLLSGSKPPRTPRTCTKKNKYSLNCSPPPGVFLSGDISNRSSESLMPKLFSPIPDKKNLVKDPLSSISEETKSLFGRGYFHSTSSGITNSPAQQFQTGDLLSPPTKLIRKLAASPCSPPTPITSPLGIFTMTQNSTLSSLRSVRGIFGKDTNQHHSGDEFMLHRRPGKQPRDKPEPPLDMISSNKGLYPESLFSPVSKINGLTKATPTNVPRRNTIHPQLTPAQLTRRFDSAFIP